MRQGEWEKAGVPRGWGLRWQACASGRSHLVLWNDESQA